MCNTYSLRILEMRMAKYVVHGFFFSRRITSHNSSTLELYNNRSYLSATTITLFQSHVSHDVVCHHNTHIEQTWEEAIIRRAKRCQVDSTVTVMDDITWFMGARSDERTTFVYTINWPYWSFEEFINNTYRKRKNGRNSSFVRKVLNADASNQTVIEFMWQRHINWYLYLMFIFSHIEK